MSPSTTRTGLPPLPGPAAPPGAAGRRRRRRSSLFAHGEPMVWLTGGALVIALAMILGLLWLVFDHGLGTFWPKPVQQIRTHDGRTILGEVTETDTYEPTADEIAALPEATREAADAALDRGVGQVRRRQLRTGNFDLTGTHFTWVSDLEILEETRPAWAVVVERLAWGRFYGTPKAFLVDGRVTAEGAAASWEAFEKVHDDVRSRWRERRRLEEDEIGGLNRRQNEAVLAIRRAEIETGRSARRYRDARAGLLAAGQAQGLPGLDARFGEVAQAVRHAEDVEATVAAEAKRVNERILRLKQANEPYRLRFDTASGREADLAVEEVVRAYAPNRLDWGGKMAVYGSRWGEFLTDPPREANSEGGVWPAIFGTVVMTLIMSILVVPFGVLAALYLREYAKAGPIVSIVRIAINNLAGVPSIVYGVFGLGFFCYVVGASIDDLFFPEYAPNPKFGKGGILWASVTLALLTLPVVIVATEEALAAVPSSMREGSYACGASKWQTIKRIVLPRALPGMITGMILAVARGAGEVAPLMLVGAVKLAPSLPVDGVFPFVHAERSFMHLGFHIYDLGFQSQNSEAARPMVFSTTLLLILIVVLLNALGMYVRARLRRKFGVGT